MRTVFTLDDAEATRLIEQEKLSITETARRLHVSRQAIYHAIHMGRVPAPNRDGGPLEDGMSQDATPPSTACAGTQPESG